MTAHEVARKSMIGSFQAYGELDPAHGSTRWETFSIGIFRVVPSSRSGVGKAGKGFYRVKGQTSSPKSAYAVVDAILERLNRERPETDAQAKQIAKEVHDGLKRQTVKEIHDAQMQHLNKA